MGWKKIGNVPPRIIAIDTIAGYESDDCLSCWIVEYGATARPFLAIDGAESGVVASLEGMNSLTGGFAVELDEIWATAVKTDLLDCGLVDGPFREL
jgi:hypothetical protein